MRCSPAYQSGQPYRGEGDICVAIMGGIIVGCLVWGGLLALMFIASGLC